MASLGSEYADLRTPWKSLVHSGGGRKNAVATEHWDTHRPKHQQLSESL